MKVKKHSYPPIHVGTPLMLVIFIILCMVIFAVLSLSSAAKDYNYSEKNATRTTAYYTACNQAEVALAEIDQIIKTSTNQEALISNLETLNYLSVSADEIVTAEYHVSVDEDEILQVVLNIHPEESSYIITTWKQQSTAEWTGDQSLPVLGNK